MVFFRDIGVGRHDLTPQNSTLFLRVKSVVRLDLTEKSSFLDGHKVKNNLNWEIISSISGARVSCLGCGHAETHFEGLFIFLFEFGNNFQHGIQHIFLFQ